MDPIEFQSLPYCYIARKLKSRDIILNLEYAEVKFPHLSQHYLTCYN